MLPNTDRLPPEFLQFLLHNTIPFFIAPEFFFPKGSVALRERAMHRAAVPKTAIDEQGHSKRGKHKIRPAKNFGVAPPALNPMPPKYRYKPQLGCTIIPTLYPGHYFRSLFRRKNVSHSFWLLRCAPRFMRGRFRHPTKTKEITIRTPWRPIAAPLRACFEFSISNLARGFRDQRRCLAN